jgi:predicted transglutaminase-like cysteine proteinase
MLGVVGRFKAALVAMLLLVPGPVMAGPLFDGSPPSSDFQLFPLWKKVLEDMATPQLSGGLQPIAFSPSDTVRPCADERHCIPQGWTEFLTGLKALSPFSQLDAVNRWANARPYVEDITNWGLPDYWETPGEFTARGGDCEDFAIAKYFSLIRLGFPSHDLRIVIVSDSQAHGFHAVLVAHLGGTVWLLDNQLPAVVPLSSQTHYTPIYSLNEQGWWLQSQPIIQAGNVVITTAPLGAESSAPMRVAVAN